jgi:hypothetical protein
VSVLFDTPLPIASICRLSQHAAGAGPAIPGNRRFCPNSFADGRCLGTNWLLAWDAYGARKNGVVLC